MLPFALALALALVGDPSEFRAPPDVDKVNCSGVRHEVLGPRLDDSGKVPTNTSLWFRENPSVSWQNFEKPRLSKLDGTVIEVEEISTLMRLGDLIQLRPRAPLAAGTEYRIETDAETIRFTTAGLEDHERPATPEVVETRSAEVSCTGSGIQVAFTHDAAGEPMLYLTEDPDGTLFNTARSNPIYIPLAANGEHLEASVVAMDLAGNRSVPSLVFVEESEGCGCSTTGTEQGSFLLARAFLISLAVLFLTKKRG